MTIYKNGITPEIKLRRKSGELAKAKITSSSAMADFARELFDKDDLEVFESFFVVYLNNQNQTIGWIKISQGGLTGTVVDVRMILKGALDCLAISMICVHNHPSGKLQASDADINMTKAIKKGGEAIDVRLLDHIILTADGFLSMQEEGQI